MSGCAIFGRGLYLVGRGAVVGAQLSRQCCFVATGLGQAVNGFAGIGAHLVCVDGVAPA